jgi:hypothetical protein
VTLSWLGVTHVTDYHEEVYNSLVAPIDFPTASGTNSATPHGTGAVGPTDRGTESIRDRTETAAHRPRPCYRLMRALLVDCSPTEHSRMSSEPRQFPAANTHVTPVVSSADSRLWRSGGRNFGGLSPDPAFEKFEYLTVLCLPPPCPRCSGTRSSSRIPDSHGLSGQLANNASGSERARSRDATKHALPYLPDLLSASNRGALSARPLLTVRFVAGNESQGRTRGEQTSPSATSD